MHINSVITPTVNKRNSLDVCCGYYVVLCGVQTSHELCKDSSGSRIECMAKAGVGLMVTLRGQAVVRLYHLETFENLQDISVTSAITRMLDGGPCQVV